jgi:hypothetical protein
MLGRRALSTAAGARRVVLVDGVRIPFQKAGTTYNDDMACTCAHPPRARRAAAASQPHAWRRGATHRAFCYRPARPTPPHRRGLP